MDGSRIESLLALASAKSARAHQRITTALDFTSAGMKAEDETRRFLTELEFARYELDSAVASLVVIRTMYTEARKS